MSSKGGGGNIGCGPILTLIGLELMVFSILNYIAELAAWWEEGTWPNTNSWYSWFAISVTSRRYLANTPSEPEKKQKSIKIWLYALWSWTTVTIKRCSTLKSSNSIVFYNTLQSTEGPHPEWSRFILFRSGGFCEYSCRTVHQPAVHKVVEEIGYVAPMFCERKRPAAQTRVAGLFWVWTVWYGVRVVVYCTPLWHPKI